MKKKSTKNDARESAVEPTSDGSQNLANKVSETAMSYRLATDPTSVSGLGRARSEPTPLREFEDEALLDDAAEALYWELDAAMDRILSKTRAVKRDLLSIRQEIALTHTLR